jgi:3-deoxy-D-manno-octulosonate 8-phosphate phosphatase (KDO 8-P phosphatase)
MNRVKLIIFDVDGTLTDGSIILDSVGNEIKKFSAKDGQVMRVLPKLGMKTAILSGRASGAVKRRGEDLKMDAVLQDTPDKVDTLRQYLTQVGIDAEHTAYIGDDLNDYAAMRICGFKACPSDATQEIRDICDYVSPYAGGHGAVRDIIECLLKQLGKWNELLQIFS